MERKNKQKLSSLIIEDDDSLGFGFGYDYLWIYPNHLIIK